MHITNSEQCLEIHTFYNFRVYKILLHSIYGFVVLLLHKAQWLTNYCPQSMDLFICWSQRIKRKMEPNSILWILLHSWQNERHKTFTLHILLLGKIDFYWKYFISIKYIKALHSRCSVMENAHVMMMLCSFLNLNDWLDLQGMECQEFFQRNRSFGALHPICLVQSVQRILPFRSVVTENNFRNIAPSNISYECISHSTDV